MNTLQTQDTLSQAELESVRRMVYGHCGIHLDSGKDGLVRARLLKRLAATGFDNAGEYVRHVLADPGGQEFGHLIDALSTNLTEFYREPHHFDFLAQRLVPELAAPQRGRRRLRAWSAGCSSGQEAYTMAMTILGALEDPAGWDLKILATDISRRMLRTAAAGVYTKEQVESVPPLLRHRYFRVGRSAEKPAFEIDPTVRDMVTFRYLNLMSPWPFRGPFDFIFCRNVMIYFDQATQQRLTDRFWPCLASGGYLFTGHSESLTGVSHRFEFVRPTIYRKP